MSACLCCRRPVIKPNPRQPLHLAEREVHLAADLEQGREVEEVILGGLAIPPAALDQPLDEEVGA